ncbi:GNAT family N-acetyltransferase [Parasphaerochaeta coccoides]|uniref:GCN5-related N-acetyltransferase n=1 Tax=Parasphaerochaeta coccoides (strain ATCC BAA-1237 / DSM 17374 / SPN1) TaxID=760011 RepID=F4GL59_PARC1|nr:GNAT family N-acetyltransferase [Parasphaerochaeta coccoides]AEC02399.1 GCN5-related N-acetyltransferase [Parasphaerochaeta coccoides DSM 17374]
MNQKIPGQDVPASYSLPLFTDELLYQLVFSMEDQDNEYLLDMATGEIIFEDNADEDKPERYLSLPPWGPADGFRIMEKFVASLRNPIHREQLKMILQSGKGVFRQFKDALHSMPPLERLWYYFKDKEIMNVISLWYERQGEVVRLSRLELEIDDDARDLLLSDFIIVQADEGHEAYLTRAVAQMGEELGGMPHGECLAARLMQLWAEIPEKQALVAMADGGEPAGFLAWWTDEKGTARIIGYRVEPEYRGMGLFRLLFDHMNRLVARSGCFTVVMPMMGDGLKLSRMFDDVSYTVSAMEIVMRVHDWNEKVKSSEEAYV